MTDRTVLNHIEELIAEEQELYSHSHLNNDQKARLDVIKVELDQFWDLLRQRRALQDAGKDPDDATLRSPDIVENYKQ